MTEQERLYYKKNRDKEWNIPHSLEYWMNFLKLDTIPKSLEVGCGRDGLWRFSESVTGLDPIDFSNEAPNFIQGYAENLPFEDKSFNTVICVNTLDHTTNPRKSLEEICRVAEKEVILWSYIYPEPTLPIFKLIDKQHDYHFTIFDLYEMIPNAFNIKEIYRKTPSELFLKYTKNTLLRLKLDTASLLGMKGTLLKLRRKPA